MEHADRRPGRAMCLTLHAGYACQSAGACCTAGWAIPVEKEAYETLVVHFGRKRRAQQLFAAGSTMPEGAAAVLERTAGGDCVFFEPSRGRLCAIHRELGPERLP